MHSYVDGDQQANGRHEAEHPSTPPQHHRMAPVPGRLPDQLATAAIEPSTVDTVVLTHLYTDHVGWAVDGLFLCARHVVQRADVEMLGPVQAEAVIDPLRGKTLPDRRRTMTDETARETAAGGPDGHRVRDGESLFIVGATPLGSPIVLS